MMMTLREYIAQENAARTEWMNAAEGRWTGLLPEAEYWEEIGIFTVEDLEHHFAVETFRDLYKDAYGFRPSQAVYEALLAGTREEQEAEIENLGRAVEEEYLRENEMKAAASARFDEEIAEMIRLGAGDAATALRWMAQANDVDLENDQDVEHMLWARGLSFETIRFWMEMLK